MGNNNSSSSSPRRTKHRDHGNGSSSYGHPSSSSSSEKYASGLPSAPGKPYLVVASPAHEPDVITVKWKSPAHDGGSKIIGYIIEHRRTISPHWVKAVPGKVRQNHLTLSGLEPGWRYQFRVKAVNSSGYSPPSVVSDPVTMTVHKTAVVAPIFVRGIEDRVALENDQVKFEVEFEGTPTPKISWYKDGFELFSNRRQRVNTDNGVSTLHIHQTEYSDEGEIKCSATNKAGHAITKARLRLEAPPMVRLPQDYEEGVLLEQNEPMRLKVSVTGRPLPQVTWFHDGEEIRGGDRFEVIHTDKYAALKLACVKRSDRGCYQIQAVNPLGEHMASFLVTVTDRPSPPGKVHVSKTSGKSVTLSWKSPEDDGGCKIGNYIIEYNRVGWDMWLKASTSRQLTADLDDLLEGSEYRFRVKAENPYGVSLPSDVSEPLFLPDIKRGVYKPANKVSLLSEDEEKLIKIQETEMLEYFGRKSKSPEPSSKPRKLSVDEVSPPVPKRRKKNKKNNFNDSETDIFKSLSVLDVSTETWQQPIEQKDHWGLPPGLKAGNNMSPENVSNSQLKSSDYKTKGNSTDSLLLNFERGSAPPISLSSPELGSESEGFDEYIRNSYSSSELLYERNLNRFNGYSTDDSASSEAQKIAIYAMDRKNSLRRSPITRTSADGSEEKSIFGDSDSIQSVVEISRKPNASSFMSLVNSIDEDDEDYAGQTADDNSDTRVSATSTSFYRSMPNISKQSDDDEEFMSDGSDKEAVTKFSSGKLALEHNASSAFFSTVYYDDDYLSDQRLSDRERSTSPAVDRLADKSDTISRDSLNSESVSSGDFPTPPDGDDGKTSTGNSLRGRTIVETKMDGATVVCVAEPVNTYRPRDGIPKYVMLPNPFYRDDTAAERSDQVKFELSSNSDEIVPPEIPRREEDRARLVMPVITVTETGEYSPKSVLKKIFAPTLHGQNEPSSSYYNRYNNVNTTTFDTLKNRSPECDWNGPTTSRSPSPSPMQHPPAERGQEDAAMVVVKHYGDIVERYSGAGKKTGSKTYLDFEQLKMAAVEDEPVLVDERPESRGEYESEPDDDDEENEYPEGPEADRGEPEIPGSATSSDMQLVVVGDATPDTVTAVPYLKIFGNLSLALFGYWLYMCKDEKLSVPVFGFLAFRFFKTQIWDRI